MRSAAVLLITCWLVGASVVACGDTATPAAEVADETVSIWGNSAVPMAPIDPDTRSVQVGTRFSTAADGVVRSVRFYQGSASVSASTATLWSVDGRALGSTALPLGRPGWREVPFSTPIPLAAGGEYIISYRATDGGYASSSGTLREGRTVTSSWLTAHAGVYTYGEGVPRETNGSNYFVDVAFEASGPSLRNVDGGPDYYARFADSLPTNPSFFPVAVWFTKTTSQAEIDADRTAGVNTYVELTTDSDLDLIAGAGMHAIPSWGQQDIAGRMTTDEADMWGGPGYARWTRGDPAAGPVCVPADAHCGFTALTELRAEVPPGIMTYAGYGKGVTFWESTDDASKFVNEFQDLVSVNNYWFTDSTTCRQTEGGKLITNGERTLTSDECHRAANYGVTTRYVRSLIEPFGSKPFWNLIEVGHPSTTDSEPTITAAQIRGAVWSSIINGARGIIYFNHSFGGPCLSFNVLRDRCGDDVRAEVTAVNHQIQRLAPVLNSPFVDGLVQSDAPVDIAAKMHDGSFYIMVGNKQNAPTEATILLSCGDASRVEVIDENRQLPMANGAFHDTFTDGNAVHLYRVVDGDTCGLPN